MDEFRAFIRGKRVTLVRIGLLGRGVGDARFLAECGAQVLVVDDASQEVMQPSVDALSQYENITFKFGPYDASDFTNCDMVLKGAGTPLGMPALEAAADNGVPIKMSTSLFAQFTPATVVGVTGTRGKSTTTHLLADILEHAGYNVFRGGNIKGVSTLAHLSDSTEDEIAVLELDSWQLQGFGYEEISPRVSIFTTFLMDHMNYYAADQNDEMELARGMERYFQDKTNIFRYQHENDLLITSEQVHEEMKQYEASAPGRHTTVSAEDIPTDWTPALPGEHNRLNTALAWRTSQYFDVSEKTAQEVIEQFGGVEGRLQYIGKYNGVAIYNDTTATTPDATMAALNALGEQEGGIVLITGGSDKGLPVGGLPRTINRYCKAVVWLPGTGTEKMGNAEYDIPNEQTQDMNEAVQKAFEVAEEGDTIVLSPAFASFGQFANEYERGESFVKAVRQI